MTTEKMLSIDIETMDTGPQAAVVAIGARLFTRDGPSKGFECFIDQMLAGQIGTVSEETMKWWAKQDNAVRDQVFSGKLHPTDALFRLDQFLAEHKPETVWANSPSFDIVILRHLYKQCGRKFPFHYRDERDFRTLYAMGRDLQVDTISAWQDMRAHNPLDDATAQAKAGALILSRIYAPTVSTPAADSNPDSAPVRSARAPRRLAAALSASVPQK